MKSISVNWEFSQNKGSENITFEQMGTTYKEFCKLSHKEQQDLIQKELNELPTRNFPVVDSFSLNGG